MEASRAAARPWIEPRGMVVAVLWAAGAAMLARGLGLPGAALSVAAAVLLTVARRRAGPWVLAVPAAMAAATLPTESRPPPRPGPVWIDGVVLAGIRMGPEAGQQRLRMRPVSRDAGWHWCIVAGQLDVLPGDRLTGPARLPMVAPRATISHGYVQTQADALRVTPGPAGAARWAEACRLALQRALLGVFEGKPGVLLCHLVLGSGPEMPLELTAAHRATGLTHLLAVSGAHASMLGWLLAIGFAGATGRQAFASRRYRWICAAILLFYGAITGMEPPVFRALVAFFLLMFARAQGRRVHASSALALPALLTAVCAPADLFSASFNLSYAAVLGLALAGAFGARSWRDRYIRLPVLGSCWATLLTMPLTLHYFGQIAPWTILATPLLAPLVAFMLAGGLLAAVAALVWSPLAVAIALPTEAVAEVYCAAVRATALLPLAPVHAVSHPDPLLLGGGALVGIALLGARPCRATVAGLSLCLSLPYCAPPPAQTPRLELAAVGHGQTCFAVLGDQSTILVDCGSLGNPRKPAGAAEHALRPARSLDLLVLTHDHHDHTCAVPLLAGRVHVARAALPAEMMGSRIARELEARGTELLPVETGAHFDPLPQVSLSRPEVDGTNDASVWVHLDLGAFSALVTGDPLEDGVSAWLRGPAVRRVDVLVLPHHGGTNARLPALLAAVQPQLALVSNRSTVRWTPQSGTARRLGVRVLETGRVGTIRVEAGTPVRVVTEGALRLD